MIDPCVLIKYQAECLILPFALLCDFEGMIFKQKGNGDIEMKDAWI